MTEIWVATAEGVWRDGEAELDGHSVAALERRGQTWWAAVDDHDVWRRDEAGEWAKVATHDSDRLNAILPLDDQVLAGTSEAHLVRIIEGAAERVESFESIVGRGEWFTPWGGPPDVRSFAVSDTGVIFANVHVGGIVRSDDRGDTWEPTIDIRSDVHEVITGDGEVVLAATARGLALSRDGGSTWQFDADGLHASYARAVALSGETVFLTASDGPFGGRAAPYRRPLDGSAVFTKNGDGLPEWFPGNIDSACLAASGRKAAFGTHDGRVFLSADSGRTWSQVAKDLPEVRALRLAA
jgi:hypothetical protein